MTHTAPSVLDPLAIRRRLSRDRWLPPRRFGGGWNFDERDSATTGRRILVTVDDLLVDEPRSGGVDWIHASISRRATMPSHADLKLLRDAVFGDGWAYHVFAPPAEHIDGSVPVLGHQWCLHLYGRSDGAPVLPDFTHGLGVI